ncbi:PD-(D/E)XK nuclease family protein [Methanogenium sp. MK-MG]|uniref:PD-(D/E)XK nuclease family protein n=1 Tax=Methanogenium sp. MK-MG TaxID=2599926 RepID=UPI0013E9A79F|nr:PD-(D/E)XK nuclease family protein [Methanogenium sp. MK-MG]KAF1078536.1 ATP-dependent helicase/deoxyribonuclease subunit B [Methanogenium sp. MK-MG]
MTADRLTEIPILPGEQQEECLRFFAGCAAADPFSAILCLPTIRLASSLRSLMNSRGIPHIPALAGTVTDVAKAILARTAPDLRIIPAEEARVMMHQAIRAHPNRGILTPGGKEGGQRLVQDLSRLFGVIAERGIDYPACLGSVAGEKSRVIGDIFADYRARLDAEGAVDGSSVYSAAADALTRSPVRFSGCIYGIHAALPEAERFLRLLTGTGGEWMVFTPAGANPAIFGPEALQSAETGDGPEWLFSEITALIPPVPLSCGTFPDRRTEFRAVGQQICDLIHTGTPPGDIAVALPDIRAEEGRLSAIFADFGIPAALSATLPLAQEPLVQALLLPLRVVTDGYERRTIVQLFFQPFFRFSDADGETVSGSDINRCACQAGIRGGAVHWQEGFDHLTERLREAAENPESPLHRKKTAADDLTATERVADAVSALIHDLRTLEKPKTMAGHVRALRDIYTRWDAPHLPPAPDTAVEEREHTALREFHRLLDRMAGTPGREGPTVSIREAAAVLMAAAAEARPEHEPDPAAVQVCGIRELQGLHLPVVFIVDLTDGRLPDIPTLLPYTTEQEERAMGTMRRRDKLREERYYFLAALSSAGERLWLSHAETDGGVLIPSPFYAAAKDAFVHEAWRCTSMPASGESRMERAGHAVRDGFRPPAVWLPESITADAVAARITTEECHRHGPCDSAFDGMLDTDTDIPGMLAERYPKDTVWSATTLEDYVTCPFRFYMRHVLGTEPLPEEERDLPATAHGTIVHEVCQLFYHDWMTSHTIGPGKNEQKEATARILAEAETVLERYARHGAAWEAGAEALLGTDGLGPGLFEEFILRETDTRSSPFVPGLFEAGFGTPDRPGSIHDAPVALPVPGQEAPLLLRGFIDRVDRMPDGTFLITDYKTGSHPKQPNILAGEALQLALYVRALEEITGAAGAGASYYAMKRRKVTNTVVMHDARYADALSPYKVQKMKKDAPPFPEIISNAVSAAARATAGVRAGRFPLADDADKCPGYCEYTRICRNGILRTLEIRRTGEKI